MSTMLTTGGYDAAQFQSAGAIVPLLTALTAKAEVLGSKDVASVPPTSLPTTSAAASEVTAPSSQKDRQKGNRQRLRTVAAVHKM